MQGMAFLESDEARLQRVERARRLRLAEVLGSGDEP
jgi:hypothetical protein